MSILSPWVSSQIFLQFVSLLFEIDDILDELSFFFFELDNLLLKLFVLLSLGNNGDVELVVAVFDLVLALGDHESELLHLAFVKVDFLPDFGDCAPHVSQVDIGRLGACVRVLVQIATRFRVHFQSDLSCFRIVL